MDSSRPGFSNAYSRRPPSILDQHQQSEARHSSIQRSNGTSLTPGEEEKLMSEKSHGLTSGGEGKPRSAEEQRVSRSTRGVDVMGAREWILMAFLSLQTGAQPLLTKNCVSKDIIITTQVMACEFFKVMLSGTTLLLRGSLGPIMKTWKPMESIWVAAIPAAIYALQNTLIQVAYRHVDAVTFSLLNQTKLISTALCNFIFLGKRQSRQQLLALCLMIIAAVLLTLGSNKQPSGSTKETVHLSPDAFMLGILPLLLASITSGLGSTYCQWIMQVRGRDPHLLTVEMCSLSFLMLLISSSSSSDGEKMTNLGFFHAWTLLAAIPPLTNAMGGILVGLVTKYAGGVQKGFSVIFGLVIAALLQFFVEGAPLSSNVVLALPLVIASTYLHSQYPYSPPKTHAA